MKNLILVAVILHLVILIVENYQFGDIIVFPRKCRTDTSKPRYNHYGIYVGKTSEDEDVGQGTNDLFHISKKVGLRKICVFGTIEDTRDDTPEKEFNFLDNSTDYTAGGTEDIKNRIHKSIEHCPLYDVTQRNCEHLATYVRYGKKISLQVGAKSEKGVVWRQRTKKLVEEIKRNMEYEGLCLNTTKN